MSSTLILTPKPAAASTQQWGLQITDLSGKTTSLTYDQVTAMPQTTVYSSLYCYGSLVAQGSWTGVRLSDLLNQIGLEPSVTSITFVASDNYKVVIPIETANRSDVIIAYQRDYTPLSEVYRLVIPYANGAIWISMITSISMGTDLVPAPENQSQAVANPLPNPGVWQDTTPSTQPTPAPTPVQQINTPEPTQNPHSQITPNTAAPSTSTEENSGKTSTFPYLAPYAIAAGALSALAVATLMIYKRKKA